MDQLSFIFKNNKRKIIDSMRKAWIATKRDNS